jgi:hypothetical protein
VDDWQADDVDSASLADLVAQIRQAVASAGHADRAAWLEEREQALRSDDGDAQRAARTDLSGVVLGMGGLNDVYYGSSAEQRRVGQLVDEMWVAVKP